MTGGQMAPTTLPGQITETSPYGRDVKTQGHPIRVSEMISTLDGACYVERVSADNVPNIIKTKKAIKKAFENALAGKGFSMVEILSICPTNWGLSPVESMNWLRENMIPYYPLGVKKDSTAEEGK
jgi:2-oxoglutarate ferredoxin oxidoreductase subunit beta